MKTQDKTYTIILHKIDETYCATVKEFPEVHTEGDSEIEALENVVGALKDLQAANSGKLQFHPLPVKA